MILKLFCVLFLYFIPSFIIRSLFSHPFDYTDLQHSFKLILNTGYFHSCHIKFEIIAKNVQLNLIIKPCTKGNVEFSFICHAFSLLGLSKIKYFFIVYSIIYFQLSLILISQSSLYSSISLSYLLFV